MDKKEARKILRVTKETSRNDIERKYSILLKKHRLAEQMKHASENGTAEGQENGALTDNSVTLDTELTVNTQKPGEYSFDQITQAYNVLMGYEVVVKSEPPGMAAPLLNKVGIDEKKAKNFFYYYKYYILAAIILIVAAVFTVKGCVNRVEPDFNVAFLGKISYSGASDKLAKSIKANVPEITEPGIDGAFITQDGSIGEQQYAMEMKATVLMAAGGIDVFILDKPSYERFAEQGAFLNLDDIAPELGADMEKHKELVVEFVDPDIIDDIEDTENGNTAEGDVAEESGGNAAADSSDTAGELHLYGIDVTQSTALKDSGVIGERFIAAIFTGCNQPEKAEKFIQFLMK